MDCVILSIYCSFITNFCSVLHFSGLATHLLHKMFEIYYVSSTYINRFLFRTHMIPILIHKCSNILCNLQKCLKTMHDLELIKSDSHLFKISWRRIKDSTANCSIIFYKNGLPIPFHGKSDRQTAVLKWIIKEIYCHTDDPLEVNPQQFEVLIRSFRNFILVPSVSFYSVFFYLD